MPVSSRHAKIGVLPVEKPEPRVKVPKPLRAKPRGKGNRAERQVIDILHGRGYQARRNFMSGGYGGADIIGGPPGFSIEVKHQERCTIWDWLAQAAEAASPTETPLVVHRANRRDFHAVLPRTDLASLLTLNGNPSCRRLVRESGRVKLWEWADTAAEQAALLSAQAIPIVDFARNGADTAGWYSDLPFETLLDLIAEAQS